GPVFPRSFRKASWAAPALASTGSTWLPSGSEVLVARTTPFRSSMEISDALTLGFATTLNSAAAAGDDTATPSIAMSPNSARLMMSVPALPELEVESETRDEEIRLRLEPVRVVVGVEPVRIHADVADAVHEVALELHREEAVDVDA